MTGVFVASYSLEVAEDGSKKASPLEFAQGKTLYSHVLQTLEQMKKAVKREQQQHILKVESLQSDGVNIVGTLRRGEYGYSSEGMDVETFETMFKRSAKQAEMLPFYFRFHLPSDEYAGIMILQRMGNHSPFSDLRGHLMEVFREANPDFKLSVGRLVPAKILRLLMEGRVKTFRVVTHKKTGDKADSFLKGFGGNVGTIETVFKAKRKHPMWLQQPKWVTDLVTGATTLAKVFPEYDRVQIGVEYRGKTRQFDVSNQDDAAPFVEITDEVTCVDGHPKFAEIDTYCIGFMDELRAQIGMAVEKAEPI